MNWKFFINDIEIDEPVGFSDFVINIKRDENWKGIFFEASLSVLSFYGHAFDILKSLKETKGLKAVAIFQASYQCDVVSDYDEAIKGKLNFGQYQETCGAECFIKMPVEQDNCTMILRNRYDQKVNIDDPTSFDRVSTLPAYDGLNRTFSLPGVELPLLHKGSVGDPQDIHIAPALSMFDTLVRPNYMIAVDNSIKTGHLISESSQWEALNIAPDDSTQPEGSPISPNILLEENQQCIGTQQIQAVIRMKGTFRVDCPVLVDNLSMVTLRILSWDGVKGITLAQAWNAFGSDAVTVLDTFIILDNAIHLPPITGSFDHTFTASYNLPIGTGLYAILYIQTVGDPGNPDQHGTIDVHFDPETSIDLRMNRDCPATNVRACLVNELAARIAESITDMCITVKSDYYGRDDSEPFAMPDDGCGSLRILTNGLKLRQADKNNEFFISLRELFDGLNAIDNIGIAIEDDPAFPNTDRRILRIEDARFFYNDTEIMRCDFIPAAVKAIIESKHYSRVLVGYDKWETTSIRGTDEFNSNKEFRTSLDAVNNPLDIKSKLVAGSYPIEITREQQFGDTGEADTTYDDETFIICMKRDGYNLIVETGNINDASNMYSPPTVYNWRIRPFYNLMRWAKSIFQCYVDLNDPDSKLFFSSGVGNYSASGRLIDGDPCKLENTIKAENDNLSALDFENPNDAIPILDAESISFDYPLSIAEYKRIKQNPHGYLSVQCGFGDYVRAYIDSINYHLVDGMATFNLILSGKAATPPIVVIEEFSDEFSDEFA